MHCRTIGLLSAVDFNLVLASLVQTIMCAYLESLSCLIIAAMRTRTVRGQMQGGRWDALIATNVIHVNCYLRLCGQSVDTKSLPVVTSSDNITQTNTGGACDSAVCS